MTFDFPCAQLAQFRTKWRVRPDNSGATTKYVLGRPGDDISHCPYSKANVSGSDRILGFVLVQNLVHGAG